jgi:DNA-binding NarL/FixJ family response regulator
MLNADSQPSYPDPIEILLVDDHHDIRRLLREIIESYKDLSIIGEAVNGEEAVLLAAKLKPAAIVMDIHLPVLSGVAVATLIKINNPFVSIIALTAGDLNEDEQSMVIAGAAAVINKGEAFHALYPAIINAVKQVKTPV